MKSYRLPISFSWRLDVPYASWHLLHQRPAAVEGRLPGMVAYAVAGRHPARDGGGTGGMMAREAMTHAPWQRPSPVLRGIDEPVVQRVVEDVEGVDVLVPPCRVPPLVPQ